MPLSRLPPWVFLLLAIAPAPLLFLKLPEGVSEALRLAIAGAVVAWGATMAWIHWRRLDEPAKAAHKWAWYCGGSAGIVVALLACGAMFYSADAARLVHDLASYGKTGDPLTRTFFYGAAFAGLAQVIGTLVAWLIWWGRRR